MGFYDNKVLPHLLNCVCSSPPILGLRQKVVPKCEGRVLEVGIGSGINLQYYDKSKVDHVWGLEPSLGMRKKAQKNLDKSQVNVEWLDLPGEQIPLEDNSVDTILLTYTLCTIPDTSAALAQMNRVLKPGGKLIFCEHGKSCDDNVCKWQDRINPYWTKVAGGCNLNRKIDRLISTSGFKIESLDEFYVEKTPKFAGFTYMGEATLGHR